MEIKARPILMNGEMVRATLEGRKTQTRRIVKENFTKTRFKGDNLKDYQFKHCYEYDNCLNVSFGLNEKTYSLSCPFGKVGDLLYVRETFLPREDLNNDDSDSKKRRYCYYKATESHAVIDGNHFHSYPNNWTPSIHMPRSLSRLTLKITDIRVERLQDISEEDALAEGTRRLKQNDDMNLYWSKKRFIKLWESINGQGSWEVNPWVWVIEFEVIKQNVDDYLSVVKNV